MNGDSNKHDFAHESLSNWAPRFVANGIDHNDLARLRDRIDAWDEWCDAFTAVGDEHAALGEDAADRDDFESAGGHFTQAAMYYHFGSHVWHVDADRRDETHRKAVETFQRGGEYLDPPLQRLEVSVSGFEVPGNLRVPAHGPDGERGDSPLVLLLPGLDSIKEELFAYEPHFHERGIATLAVDGAAQGETWYEQGMTPEYPKYISAVIDYVQDEEFDGLDTSRLGVYGVSLGGFYAPFVAANDHRIDACVGISGPFAVGPVSSRESNLVKEQFKWACKTDSLVEVDDITEEMSLRNDIENLTAPALMMTGTEDHIIPPEQTERIAKRASNGEYVLYEGGNHVCNNIPYKYRPRAADWLRSKLA